MTKLKYSFLLLLALLLSVSSFAQRPRGHERPPRLEALKDELQLSEQQLEQIDAIEEKYRDKMRALREQYAGDPEEERDAWRGLREARREEIHGVLTEEQRATLQAKRTAREAEREARQSERRELREEVQAYLQANVLPVLKEQRARLESQLSAEDKALIAELRQQHESIRAKMKAAQGDPEQRQALRDELKERRGEREQLRGLVEKYEAGIERLFTEIMDERQQWRRDLQQLHENHRPETREEATPRFRREGPRKQRERQRHHRDGGRHDGIMGKGAFLLLDPRADAPAPLDIDDLTPGLEPEIYPNPAGQFNTVRYEIKTPGVVRIELRDAEGRLLRVLLDEYHDRGTYTEDVDVNRLADGVYYYTITTGDGTVTKQVVVSKR